MHKVPVLPLIVAVTGAIAACGGSSSSTSASGSSSSSSSAPASSSSSSTATATTSSTAAAPVEITTKHSKLGTILAVGPKHLTVYLFEADKGPRSTCAGPCAAAWPPVIGKPKATGAAASSDLGTLTRSDGRMQVTYKGHPLYTFVRDKDKGDAYGEGNKAFGASWYVLTPAGKKVDNS